MRDAVRVAKLQARLDNLRGEVASMSSQTVRSSGFPPQLHDAYHPSSQTASQQLAEQFRAAVSDPQAMDVAREQYADRVRTNVCQLRSLTPQQEARAAELRARLERALMAEGSVRPHYHPAGPPMIAAHYPCSSFHADASHLLPHGTYGDLMELELRRGSGVRGTRGTPCPTCGLKQVNPRTPRLTGLSIEAGQSVARSGWGVESL